MSSDEHSAGGRPLSPGRRSGEHTALDRLVHSLRSWGTGREDSDEREQGRNSRPRPRSSHGIGKRSSGSMRSFRRTKKSSRGFSSNLSQDAGIGQSPVFRPPRQETTTFALSRRSSGASSSSLSYSSGRRRSDETPGTSIGSISSPKSATRPRFGSTRAPLQADATQPLTLDLYQPRAQERNVLSQTGGSFVAALGLQPLPAPRQERVAPLVQHRPAPLALEPPKPLTTPLTTIRSHSPAPVLPLSSPVSTVRPAALDDAVLGRTSTAYQPAHLRRRSRSASDIRISLQPPRSPATTIRAPATAGPSRSAARSPPPRVRVPAQGPIIFEPVDATCETWIAPKPRLVGHYKSSDEDAELVHRRDRSTLTAAERRAQAARAQHRASNLARKRVSSTPEGFFDPRSRSQPVGSWSAQAGVAEPASPPVGTSFSWASSRGWRNPRRPRTRTIATQTPSSPLRRTKSASSLHDDVREEQSPAPGGRASSLSYYRNSLQRSRSPRPASVHDMLAEPLSPERAAYPLDVQELAANRTATATPVSLAPPPRRVAVPSVEEGSRIDSSITARPSTGEQAIQAGSSSHAVQGGIITPTLGGAQQEHDDYPFPQNVGSEPPSASTQTEFSNDSRSLGPHDSMNTLDGDEADYAQLFYAPPPSMKTAGSEMTPRPSLSDERSAPSVRSGRTVYRGQHATDDAGRRASHASSSPLAVGFSNEAPMTLQASPEIDGYTHDWSATPSSATSRMFEAGDRPRLRDVLQLPVQVTAAELSRISSHAETTEDAVTAPTTPMKRPVSQLSADSWLEMDHSPAPPVMRSRQVPASRAEEVNRASSFLDFDMESPARISVISGSQLVTPQPSDFDIEIVPVAPPVTPAASSKEAESPTQSTSGTGSLLSSPAATRGSVGLTLSPGSPQVRDSGSYRSRLSLEAFPSPPLIRPRGSSIPAIGEEVETGPRGQSKSLDSPAAVRERRQLSADWLEFDSPERSLNGPLSDQRSSVSAAPSSSLRPRSDRSRSHSDPHLRNA